MFDLPNQDSVSRRDLLKAASLAAVGSWGIPQLTRSFAAEVESSLVGEFLTAEKTTEGLVGDTGLHWGWSNLTDRDGLVGEVAQRQLVHGDVVRERSLQDAAAAGGR